MTVQRLLNLSPSMLSFMERGKADASIGTLMVISSALGVHIGLLLREENPGKEGSVARATDQPVHESLQGVLG